ncbi:hypothetical protein BVRB_1g014200 [Beta vulgaris subsp. vulgaris]|nr:hypothetical protein BVRB_1g014200 [Beta vulgaris subsp. vulgaris]
MKNEVAAVGYGVREMAVREMADGIADVKEKLGSFVKFMEMVVKMTWFMYIVMHPQVPLMEIKYCTEKFLQDYGLNHMTIRLCGFMQGLIGQYAVPILEEKFVCGTDAQTRIAYMDTQFITQELNS